MNIKIISFLLIIFNISIVHALPIDEKLTLRILNVSETRKTILINRGLEDGLEEGDHARFFLSFGVVARGYVTKISPTRSVWSLYRLVNVDYIKPDVVMNLKITEPLKVTEDKTKMIVTDQEASEDLSYGIPLAPGADDIDKTMTKEDRSELLCLNNTTDSKVNFSTKNFEPIISLSFSKFSTSYKGESLSSSIRESNPFRLSSILGMEFYFKDFSKWYSRFSFLPFINLEFNNSDSYKESFTEFGAMINYSFLDNYNMSDTLIPFAFLGIALGKSSLESLPKYDAKTNTFHLGGGVKYYLRNGFGLRANLDYVMRTLSYTETTSSPARDESMSGPIFYLTLTYRF